MIFPGIFLLGNQGQLGATSTGLTLQLGQLQAGLGQQSALQQLGPGAGLQVGLGGGTLQPQMQQQQSTGQLQLQGQGGLLGQQPGGLRQTNQLGR